MPPIYHRTRDSIEARRTIVFAALAVSRWMKSRPAGQRKFARTARRYRTVEIQAGPVSSPPPTYRPTTSANSSTASTVTQVRTNLSQVIPEGAGP